MQEEDMISLNEFKALVEIYQGFKFLKGETDTASKSRTFSFIFLKMMREKNMLYYEREGYI